MCAAAETKITYEAASHIDRYQVQLFLFTPVDLTTVSNDLYSNLRSTVRLHTPKVRGPLRTPHDFAAQPTRVARNTLGASA
jgi:hypothetical protein